TVRGSRLATQLGALAQAGVRARAMPWREYSGERGGEPRTMHPSATRTDGPSTLSAPRELPRREREHHHGTGEGRQSAIGDGAKRAETVDQQPAENGAAGDRDLERGHQQPAGAFGVVR